MTETTIQQKINYITHKELNDNITKIIPFEYYLQMNELIETSDNEKSVRFNIDNEILKKKTLKSLHITIISKTINEINNYITDLECTFQSYTCTLWMDKFIQGQNYLYGIILPLGALIYDNFYISITKIDKILNIMDNLELKISGEYLELCQDMEKKLTELPRIQQKMIIKNEYNIFGIKNGMVGMMFDPFLSREKYDYYHQNMKFDDR